MRRRSKRLAAWNFAWTHIESIAGMGELSPSDAQKALRRQLGELAEMPLPGRAIEALSMAVLAAYQVGLDSARGG